MQLVLGQTLESIWDKQQLVRDRAWCMKQKGKPVGLSFEGLAIAESVYYALRQGRPVSASQVRALDNFITKFSMHTWQKKDSYPAWRGMAPAPGGYAFLDDDDDDDE
jgi:hypothetical protein